MLPCWNSTKANNPLRVKVKDECKLWPVFEQKLFNKLKMSWNALKIQNEGEWEGSQTGFTFRLHFNLRGWVLLEHYRHCICFCLLDCEKYMLSKAKSIILAVIPYAVHILFMRCYKMLKCTFLPVNWIHSCIVWTIWKCFSLICTNKYFPLFFTQDMPFQKNI